MTARSFALVFASLVAGSFAGGCAGASVPAEDVESQEQDATSTRPEDLAKYVGSYEWREGTSGSFVDFTQLTLVVDGTFTAVADEDVTGNPIRCIKAPCASPVDGTWAVTRSHGVTKLRIEVQGRPNRSYHVAVEADGLELTRDTVSTKLFKVEPAADCHKTGCSGTVCADHDVMTTCQFRPEYACYHDATCERQADGQCGFRATPELTQCLSSYVDGGSEEPAPCKKTGCSGTVCADHDVMTTCEFREEYACYHDAICERQTDGQCGFRTTPELTQCLASHSSQAD